MEFIPLTLRNNEHTALEFKFKPLHDAKACKFPIGGGKIFLRKNCLYFLPLTQQTQVLIIIYYFKNSNCRNRIHETAANLLFDSIKDDPKS